MSSATIDMATLVLSGIAAAGSIVRVAQNERSYKLMKKLHKKKKK